MPPEFAHKTLSQSQKDTIRQWVAEGARYEGHWSFQPIRRPPVPDVAQDNFRNPIDAFIQVRLAKEGLTLSPEADRRTLIRRVTLDLTGLPPTPAEVEAFSADRSPDAYEKLVNRLLASPRFAEKQTMHWLDAVRYADTRGFHNDIAQPAWPYRDYVLRSFLSNKPFDTFTTEQIAGDLLPESTIEQKVATAYNRILRTSQEGGIQDKEYLAKYGADRVRTTSGVFLGLTMGCAECHDHKFDPITARDFYSMKAFFSDIKERGILPASGPNAWSAKLALPTEERQCLRRVETRDSLPALASRMVVIVLQFALGLLLLSSPLSAEPKTLEIYWIDVEGGAATLIVTPAGESVLIDAGQDLERDVSRIHHLATQVAKLKTIDHFVATHWHADHYGGAMMLSERIPIRHFYDRGKVPAELPEDPSFPTLMPRYQRMTRGKAQALRPGRRLMLKQPSDKTALSLLCLASSGEVIQARHSANPLCTDKLAVSKDESDNALSVVLKLEYGKFSFFDGGDLTLAMEKRLVCPADQIGGIDLMQIDHHGLDQSNHPVLIRSLRPRVVVVNNGPDKGAETRTMQTLKTVPGIEGIWQVHRNLKAGTDGNTDAKRIANHAADCKAEYIKASVEPTGKFTVQIGSHGTRQSYPAH